MPLPLTKVLINTAAAVKARLLLAHGAGAGADSCFMQQLAQQLAERNIEVWRFNFAYMQRFIDTGKRSLPPKMPLLQTEFSQQINNSPADLPLFVGGKSMGGRVASMLSQHSNVKAVFAFGYPFHAPKKLNWRTEHFATLASLLFIAQGERDSFGTRDELAAMQWSDVTMHWLTDGDHDFKPRVKSGLTQQQLIAAAAQFCSRSIDEILLAAK
ncbi:putative alpha/beta-hydrolase family hydrolase [Rheinheimera pacifica]|uniref:alpha/beta family hydrolase n=1 Tax=Rheinheimera pacifica TaxID=173990 RepID=UPI0021684D4E|nr:alpha/beta family hydrolase [Rheinheimera pacifica]MCS4305697.1 putative alpha/beta-hydrolase family hydrolase [Rheinheimera pacifica]